MKNTIAIIGSGASGIVAAIVASAHGAKVTLFEQNSQIGKKILASGNGRCNISNTNLSINHYFTQNSSFVNTVLKEFDFLKFQKFCTSIGIVLDIKQDGKVYPLSNEAKSVIKVFQECLNRYSIKVLTNTKVTSITKKENTFVISCKEKSYKFDKVLLATGSSAAPNLGGNCDGYKFAKEFGHTILKPFAALVGLEIDSSTHAKMAGVKIFGKVSVIVDNKIKQTILGDILFTKYGVSGFGVLDISTYVSYTLIQNKSVEISLDLLTSKDTKELSFQIAQMIKSLPMYKLSTILCAILPSKVVTQILKSCNILDDNAKNISTKMIKQIVYKIKNYRFKIKDTHGFKHAEVSGGGVSTSECDAKSMQSKLVDGLYFSGEVLDVVGKRGGYNLHFAFASGYLAAKHLSS